MESKMLESQEFEIKPQGTFGYLTTLFISHCTMF